MLEGIQNQENAQALQHQEQQAAMLAQPQQRQAFIEVQHLTQQVVHQQWFF